MEHDMESGVIKAPYRGLSIQIIPTLGPQSLQMLPTLGYLDTYCNRAIPAKTQNPNPSTLIPRPSTLNRSSQLRRAEAKEVQEQKRDQGLELCELFRV